MAMSQNLAVVNAACQTTLPLNWEPIMKNAWLNEVKSAIQLRRDLDHSPYVFQHVSLSGKNQAVALPAKKPLLPGGLT